MWFLMFLMLLMELLRRSPDGAARTRAGCTGSVREGCCAAVCQALQSHKAALLRSGLVPELIAGVGQLLSTLQVRCCFPFPVLPTTGGFQVFQVTSVSGSA